MSADTPREVVEPADIIHDVGLAEAAGQVRESLPPIQRVGVWLAVGVGALIATVTLILVIHWAFTCPGMPMLAEAASKEADSASKAEEFRKAIENYKLLSELTTDRTVKIFNSFVASVLLPVFTSVLGYIFGTRSSTP